MRGYWYGTWQWGLGHQTIDVEHGEFFCESRLAVEVVPPCGIRKIRGLCRCVHLAVGAVSPGGVSNEGIF
ncbi:hypothetical protein DEO72_LG3g938 [Vigna unguiculata]|uniref:Uncharacterized protein n=1 Tax=Vigna unguiculata TaxID=3917 RepID=A0A4D6LDD8_VIGUN|nr:hypothetical protein DEO72_LG3g938 [Vigna unguiculata]